MTKETNCPKCGGHMHPGTIKRTEWFVPDRVFKGFFGAPPDLHVNAALACVECGFVETYIDTTALRKYLGLPEKD